MAEALECSCEKMEQVKRTALRETEGDSLETKPKRIVLCLCWYVGWREVEGVRQADYGKRNHFLPPYKIRDHFVGGQDIFCLCFFFCQHTFKPGISGA